ncbi:MAG: hypothetical protein KA144_04070 [Xanthomonadaceae bacterium]|nr:hypothetical protein [Xanthomonadaceae bacterium]
MKTDEPMREPKHESIDERGIFLAEYEVRPAPHSEDFATVGGASVVCLVRAVDADAAHAACMRYFADTAWEFVERTRTPQPLAREEVADDDEALDAFEEATTHGECFLFHLWSPEPGEDDALH